jgi:hypothetical protein
MLRDIGHGMIDTTTFDADGNIIRVRFFRHDHLRQEWDQSHNVIRQMDFGEFSAYYICRYDTMRNYVVKEMQRMYDIDWNTDLAGLDVRESHFVFYRRDEFGRMAEEIDTDLKHAITSYTYKDDKLVDKSEYFGNASYAKRWLYSYNGDNLVRIDFYWGKYLSEIDYFDENGLKSFTVNVGRFDKPNDTIRYSFIYY